MGFSAPASHLQSEVSPVDAVWEDGMRALVARPKTFVEVLELLVVKVPNVHALLLEQW